MSDADIEDTMETDVPSGGFDGNMLMNFSTATGEVFTKTPANVKGIDHLAQWMDPKDSPAPPKSTAKKRKGAAKDNDNKQTPTKKPRKSAGGKGAEKGSATKANATSPNNVEATPIPAQPKKQTRRRDPKKKTAKNRTIARSLEECGPADQALITMRDAGSDWGAIRAKWQELTNDKTAASTLPNRYARLKANFTVIKEDDNARLLVAKREVEESFEAQKWDLVARVVQEKGGDNYAGVVLQRQYKKLMVNQGAMPPAGVKDPDFEVELPSDME